jgi:hypothetical protein
MHETNSSNRPQHGKPVSESHVSSWMEMTSERVRRVLKIHPEFLNLSDSEQVAISEILISAGKVFLEFWMNFRPNIAGKRDLNILYGIYINC